MLWRIGSVVVGPMPNQAAMVWFLTDLLGREPEVAEGVYLWRDPVVELRDRGPDRGRGDRGPSRQPRP